MAHIQTIQCTTGKSYKAIIKQGDRVLKTKTFRTKKLAKQWVKAMEGDRANIRALGMRGAWRPFSQLADEYDGLWAGRDGGPPVGVAPWAEFREHAQIVITDIEPPNPRAATVFIVAGKQEHHMMRASILRF
jgi:hypothetical protein